MEQEKDIDKKFDQYEKIVERSSKLILKIITAIGAVVLGVFLLWQQLGNHATDNGRVKGVVQEMNIVGDVLDSIMTNDDSSQIDTVITIVRRPVRRLRRIAPSPVDTTTVSIIPTDSTTIDTLPVRHIPTSIDTISTDTLCNSSTNS